MERLAPVHEEPSMYGKIKEELVDEDEIMREELFTEDGIVKKELSIKDGIVKEELSIEDVKAQEELLADGVVKELSVKDEIVKEEPFSDEFGTIEEDSGMLDEIKEERNFKNSWIKEPLDQTSVLESSSNEGKYYKSLEVSSFPVVPLDPLDVTKDHQLQPEWKDRLPGTFSPARNGSKRMRLEADFIARVLAFYKKDRPYTIVTREEYEDLVDNIKKGYPNPNFKIQNVLGKEQLVRRKNYEEQFPLPVACVEDFYDIIRSAHELAGHGGRDKVFHMLRKTYSNIPRDVVGLYKDFCYHCKPKTKTRINDTDHPPSKFIFIPKTKICQNRSENAINHASNPALLGFLPTSSSSSPSSSRPDSFPVIIPSEEAISSPGESHLAHVNVSVNKPLILQHIGNYFGPSKTIGKMKCKLCDKEISYSAISYDDLESHYKRQHRGEYTDFLAALSAGSKRGRRTYGARYTSSKPSCSNAMDTREEKISSPGEGHLAHDESVDIPLVLQHIGNYFGPSKTIGKLKCKLCNNELSYSTRSYYNIKSHYKRRHRGDYADFLAALSSGSKRGRHLNEARLLTSLLTSNRPDSAAAIFPSEEEISSPEDSSSSLDNASVNSALILQHFGNYFGPSKTIGKMKCKLCNKKISYSANSYYRLKTHYETQHCGEYTDLEAALSADSDCGRHSSGARLEADFIPRVFDYYKKDRPHTLITGEEYEGIVDDIKKGNPNPYFKIQNVLGKEQLVRRKNNEEEFPLPLACVEDFYNIIRNVHESTKHGGRNKVFEILRKSYSNIPRDVVGLYKDFCQHCTTKPRTRGKRYGGKLDCANVLLNHITKK